MTDYEHKAMDELRLWKKRMTRKPSFTGILSKRIQTRINRLIPERVHAIITGSIKQMTRAVLLGAEYTTSSPLIDASLEERENRVLERINFYRNTAAAEGAITGAGGILLGLADFPLWLTLKIKMLFEIAALFGKDTKLLKERIFILYIFELTFSSQIHRTRLFPLLENWEKHQQELPDDIHAFDWRSFQQEYRDYIDIAKLLQLIPGFGAPVGALVNHRLTTRLGMHAMHAYRMRWFARS